MNSKIKKSSIFTIVFFILSISLIFLIKNVDVASVGTCGRVVGLSSVNKFFYDLFGYNMFWYKLTNYPGMIADFLVGGVFAVVGLKQLIERRNIFKVDANLLVLGGTYIISCVIYFLFEKFVVNYRPIILPDEKIWEPSFPSSHTMFAIIVMGTAIIECGRLIKNVKLTKIMNIFLCSIALITIFGRTISGVHWSTDILGGIFIGFTMLSSYSLVVNILNSRKLKNI